jgi:hypothetical protein
VLWSVDLCCGLWILRCCCRSPGVVVCGSPGVVVCRSPSAVVCGSPGVVVCGSPGVLICGSPGVLICGSPGVLICGSPGIVVCGSPGVVVCRSPGVVVWIQVFFLCYSVHHFYREERSSETSCQTLPTISSQVNKVSFIQAFNSALPVSLIIRKTSL